MFTFILHGVLKSFQTKTELVPLQRSLRKENVMLLLSKTHVFSVMVSSRDQLSWWERKRLFLKAGLCYDILCLKWIFWTLHQWITEFHGITIVSVILCKQTMTLLPSALWFPLTVALTSPPATTWHWDSLEAPWTQFSRQLPGKFPEWRPSPWKVLRKTKMRLRSPLIQPCSSFLPHSGSRERARLSTGRLAPRVYCVIDQFPYMRKRGKRKNIEEPECYL